MLNAFKFTLHDIILHLGRQVNSADAEFQIHQQMSWIALKEANNEGVNSVYYGINATEKLNVQEMEFEFNIVPVYPNIFQKIWSLISPLKKDVPFSKFRFQHNPSSAENHHIKITFSREGNGKYNPVIASNPPLQTKPEETYVTHLPG